MVSWKFFIGRRKINPRAWINAGGIKTYAALVKQLAEIGVSPPNEEEVSDLFVPKKVEADPFAAPDIKVAAAATAPKKAKAKPKAKVTTATKKKSTGRKSADVQSNAGSSS